MKTVKKITRAFRIFLFAFLFAICMVIGIVPVIPSRKEQFQIEVKMEENEKGIESGENILVIKADN